MNYTSLPGTYQSTKKNGDIYYRSVISHNGKRISLGSYETQNKAHLAYLQAKKILIEDKNYSIESYSISSPLPFEKYVCLINFRDNGIYIKNPVYLKNGYFIYYFNLDDYYLFDIDELFYYSEHKIMKRGSHLFVSDFGMQISILSRYGIKNYARIGIDYKFINGNTYDLRAENIHLINCYNGVTREHNENNIFYTSKIHINGNYIIGRYKTDIEAAIAYNKAIDTVKSNGCKKNFQYNYIEHLPDSQYEDIYQSISISPKLYNITF